MHFAHAASTSGLQPGIRATLAWRYGRRCCACVCSTRRPRVAAEGSAYTPRAWRHAAVSRLHALRCQLPRRPSRAARALAPFNVDASASGPPAPSPLPPSPRPPESAPLARPLPTG